jgi:NADH-quinone oxidoreductase subunit L
MFVGVGVGAYAAGIVHLVTHAFFKALLFLGAGSVIHGMHGEQDLRKMGGLAPKMLTTTVTFFVGALGLAGVPPLAGFFSKDAILGAALHEGHTGLFLLLLAGAFMTAFYTFRLVFLTFFGAPRMSREALRHVHESPGVMTLPLVVLAAATLVAGVALGVPSSHGTPFERFLSPLFAIAESAHGLLVPLVSAAVALGGVALAWAMYGRGVVRADRIGVARNPIHRLLLEKYWIDELYDAVIVQPLYAFSRWCARVFDLRGIDGAVNGLGRAVVAWASGLRRVQTGLVMNYALSMLLGAIAMVAILLAR